MTRNVVERFKRRKVTLSKVLRRTWQGVYSDAEFWGVAEMLIAAFVRKSLGKLRGRRSSLKKTGYHENGGQWYLDFKHRPKDGSKGSKRGRGRGSKPKIKDRQSPLYRHASRSGMHADTAAKAVKGTRAAEMNVQERIAETIGEFGVMFADGTLSDNMVRFGLEYGFWKTVGQAFRDSRPARTEISRAQQAEFDRLTALDLAGGRLLADMAERENSLSLWINARTRVCETINARSRQGKTDIAILDLLEQGKSHRQIAAYLRQNGTKIGKSNVARRIGKIQSLCLTVLQRIDPMRPTWADDQEAVGRHRYGIDYDYQQEHLIAVFEVESHLNKRMLATLAKNPWLRLIQEDISAEVMSVERDMSVDNTDYIEPFPEKVPPVALRPLGFALVKPDNPDSEPWRVPAERIESFARHQRATDALLTDDERMAIEAIVGR